MPDQSAAGLLDGALVATIKVVVHLAGEDRHRQVPVVDAIELQGDRVQVHRLDRKTVGGGLGQHIAPLGEEDPRRPVRHLKAALDRAVEARALGAQQPRPQAHHVVAAMTQATQTDAVVPGRDIDVGRRLQLHIVLDRQGQILRQVLGQDDAGPRQAALGIDGQVFDPQVVPFDQDVEALLNLALGVAPQAGVVEVDGQAQLPLGQGRLGHEGQGPGPLAIHRAVPGDPEGGGHGVVQGAPAQVKLRQRPPVGPAAPGPGDLELDPEMALEGTRRLRQEDLVQAPVHALARQALLQGTQVLGQCQETLLQERRLVAQIRDRKVRFDQGPVVARAGTKLGGPKSD